MKILVTTSTFPVSETDHAPAFVRDQVIAMKNADASLDITVLIPHNSYSDNPPNTVTKPSHVEQRYHYAWPHSLEKLTGRGILPALKQNPLRYLLVPCLLFGQYRALSQQITRDKPDILYAHWFMPQGILAARAAAKHNIPFVFTTHASDVSVLHKLPFGLGKKIVHSGCKQATQITAVSERTAAKLASFYSDQQWKHDITPKLSIIPMGTDVQPVSLPKKQVVSLLEGMQVPLDKKLIVSMSRLSSKKGLTYLIDAFAKIPKNIQDDYQLVIAGDGQLMQDLQQQATSQGVDDKTTFAGYVSGESKQALLQAMDIFTLPSIIDEQGDSEGLPVTLMEALSHKKLVIASNVSGAEEVLTEDSGILINQKSSSELATGLTKLAKLTGDKASSMRNSAHKLAASFDWNTVAKQHITLLKKAKKEA